MQVDKKANFAPVAAMLLLVIGCSSTINNKLLIDGQQYEQRDLGPFAPSGAVYFMDGSSQATVKIYATGDTLTFDFSDANTSISASEPILYTSSLKTKGMFLPVPEPLKSVAFYPKNTPSRYQAKTTTHLMQVVSMDMRDSTNRANLLIGLPYAEKYPKVFFDTALLGTGISGAASYGIVQSLTSFTDPVTGQPSIKLNGYPAKSFFAVYHILETKFGTFFNKKATQMELQPNEEGKLALTLPPLPFNYELINAPIPLYDINDPNGPAIAEITLAHHNAKLASSRAIEGRWPW